MLGAVRVHRIRVESEPGHDVTTLRDADFAAVGMDGDHGIAGLPQPTAHQTGHVKLVSSVAVSVFVHRLSVREFTINYRYSSVFDFCSITVFSSFDEMRDFRIDSYNVGRARAY